MSDSVRIVFYTLERELSQHEKVVMAKLQEAGFTVFHLDTYYGTLGIMDDKGAELCVISNRVVKPKNFAAKLRERGHQSIVIDFPEGDGYGLHHVNFLLFSEINGLPAKIKEILSQKP